MPISQVLVLGSIRSFMCGLKTDTAESDTHSIANVIQVTTTS